MAGPRGSLTPDNPEVKVAAEFVRRWNLANLAVRNGTGTHEHCAQILAEAGRFAICLWEEEFRSAHGGRVPTATMRADARQRVSSSSYEAMCADGLFCHKAAQHELKRHLLDDKLTAIERSVGTIQAHLKIPKAENENRRFLLRRAGEVILRYLCSGFKEFLLTPWTIAGIFAFLLLFSFIESGFVEWLGHLQEERRAQYCAALKISKGQSVSNCEREQAKKEANPSSEPPPAENPGKKNMSGGERLISPH